MKLVALALLASSAFASTGGPEPRIPWSCPQISAGTLPQQAMLSPAEILSLVSAARANLANAPAQRLNYSECFDSAIEKLPSNAPDLHEIRGEILKYSFAALQAGAIPRLEAAWSGSAALSEPRIAELSEKLATSCSATATPEALRRDFLGNPALKKRLLSVSPKCRQLLRSSFTQALLETIPSSRECGKPEYHAICTQRREAVAQAVHLLQDAGVPFTGQGQTQALAPQAPVPGDSPACIPSSSATSPEAWIAELLSDLQPSLSCVKLKAGEAVPVSMNAEPFRAGYELQRLADSNGRARYRATLRIRFLPESRQKEFEAKAQQCFDEAAPQLLGPDGEKLELKIRPAGPATADSPAPHEITVFDGKIRENERQWSTHTSCPTILHESLHLMGLVDEYPERYAGYMADETGAVLREKSDRLAGVFYHSDCRSIGPKDSIMSRPTAAFSAIQGESPARRSLLYGAHFRALTQPGCLSENRLYYLCGKEARKTSVEIRISGDQEFVSGSKNCGQGLPPECFDPEGGWVQ